MNAQEIQFALLQLLAHYDRSGVKNFCTSATPEIPRDWLAKLLPSPPAHPEPNPNASTAVPPTDSSAAAKPVQNRTPEPSPISIESTSSRPPIPTSSRAAAPSHNLSGPWELPVLATNDRAALLQEIDAEVRACRKCEELVCYRRRTVLGEGNLHPKICFFGEAPGADEDAQGRPFVGAAGQLLNKIITAMKLKRDDVYILNSLKCRPPQNRTPLPDEIANCLPFAQRQLDILQPDYIILLGAVAVRSVLQSAESVGRLRGRFHHYRGAKVLVTYHPAYLLRNPTAKKSVWEDVQMVMRELGLSGN